MLVVLPPEPDHDATVEAHENGALAVRWRDHDGLRWMPIEGRRSKRPEDWANIVEAAIRYGWGLRVVPPAQLVLEDPKEGQ